MAVYVSFHYQRDHFRVQQVLKMGVIEGQRILEVQDWEQVKRRGTDAIKKWIEDQMAYKTAVVVLVGAETANRPWVQYEIEYAWRNRKPLVGIRIHGMKDASGRTDRMGPNPFSMIRDVNGSTLANSVPMFDPAGYTSQAIYDSIKRNLSSWITRAVRRP